MPRCGISVNVGESFGGHPPAFVAGMSEIPEITHCEVRLRPVQQHPRSSILSYVGALPQAPTRAVPWKWQGESGLGFGHSGYLLLG